MIVTISSTFEADDGQRYGLFKARDSDTRALVQLSHEQMKYVQNRGMSLPLGSLQTPQVWVVRDEPLRDDRGRVVRKAVTWPYRILLSSKEGQSKRESLQVYADAYIGKIVEVLATGTDKHGDRHFLCLFSFVKGRPSRLTSAQNAFEMRVPPDWMPPIVGNYVLVGGRPDPRSYLVGPSVEGTDLVPLAHWRFLRLFMHDPTATSDGRGGLNPGRKRKRRLKRS